jgi:hypothetical protein
MGMMRKSRMTPDQAAERDAMIGPLVEAGWTTTPSHQDFDGGRFARDFQAELEHRARGMKARIKLKLEDRVVVLFLTADDGTDIELEIEYKDKLEALIRQVVTSQDAFTPSGYKAEITKLHAVCPDMYRWLNEKRIPVVK